MLSRVTHIKVGDPERQAEKLRRAICNHGPEEILMDKVGYNGDVPLLMSGARVGVSVIASMHDPMLHDVLRNPPLLPLLGVSVDEVTRELVERSDSCFGSAIKVQGKGQYRLHPDLNRSVSDLLAGRNPTILEIGSWPAA